MITTIVAMQQLTDAVANGVALQRSACERIDAAAKLLTSTSEASKSASVGIDDLAKSLRERVNVIVSDVHPKSAAELAHAPFARLGSAPDAAWESTRLLRRIGAAQAERSKAAAVGDRAAVGRKVRFGLEVDR